MLTPEQRRSLAVSWVWVVVWDTVWGEAWNDGECRMMGHMRDMGQMGADETGGRG